MLAFDFMADIMLWGIVGYRSGHYGDICLNKCLLSGFEHLAGAFDVHYVHTVRFGKSHRTADKRHFSAAPGSFGSKRIAHFTGGEITDETHWVDTLVCRAGRNQDFFA